MTAIYNHGDGLWLVGSGTPVTVHVARHDCYPHQYRVAYGEAQIEGEDEIARGEQRWKWAHELTRTRPPRSPEMTVLAERGAALITAGRGRG